MSRDKRKEGCRCRCRLQVGSCHIHFTSPSICRRPSSIQSQSQIMSTHTYYGLISLPPLLAFLYELLQVCNRQGPTGSTSTILTEEFRFLSWLAATAIRKWRVLRRPETWQEIRCLSRLHTRASLQVLQGGFCWAGRGGRYRATPEYLFDWRFRHLPARPDPCPGVAHTQASLTVLVLEVSLRIYHGVSGTLAARPLQCCRFGTIGAEMGGHSVAAKAWRPCASPQAISLL